MRTKPRIGRFGRQFNAYGFRVTQSGRWTSILAKLPQLINVLLGQMSIVGPTPVNARHADYFERHDPEFVTRHLVRPGMTGLAMVNGCDQPIITHGQARAHLHWDMRYIRNWSVRLDLGILLASLTGKGGAGSRRQIFQDASLN